MPSASKRQFRTSLPGGLELWPDRALPRLPIVRLHALVTDGDPINWRPRLNSATGIADRQPLPPEWVFHCLADADLDNDQAVTNLLDEYGIMPWPYFDPWSVPVERHDHMAPWPPIRHQHWWRTQDTGTLEDARWWLKAARAMVNTWVDYRLGDDPADAWARESFADMADYPSPRSDPWWRLQDALSAGLVTSHPRVEYAVADHTTAGLPWVGLYSAACIDIFNLLVENPEPRLCANANCGRVFIRQIGRSRYEQSRRQGVKFCSARCAKAQAQRDLYHRRKAAKTKEEQR